LQKRHLEQAQERARGLAANEVQKIKKKHQEKSGLPKKKNPEVNKMKKIRGKVGKYKRGHVVIRMTCGRDDERERPPGLIYQ